MGVIGMKQRDGKVKAEPLPNTSAKAVHAAVRGYAQWGSVRRVWAGRTASFHSAGKHALRRDDLAVGVNVLYFKSCALSWSDA